MCLYFSPNQEASFPGLSNSKFSSRKSPGAMLGMKFCLELKVIPLFIDILIKFGEDVL